MILTLINDNLGTDEEGNLWGRAAVWSHLTNQQERIWMRFRPDAYPEGFCWKRPSIHGGGSAKIDYLTVQARIAQTLHV